MISTRASHAALVSEEHFIAVQAVRSARPNHDGTTRTYLLTGLLRCGICGRRMDAHWINNRPGYRCRHGHTSTTGPNPDQPRGLYLREDHVLDRLAKELNHPDRDAHALIEYLRAEQITLTCDHTWADTTGPRHPSPTHSRKRKTFMG